MCIPCNIVGIPKYLNVRFIWRKWLELLITRYLESQGTSYLETDKWQSITLENPSVLVRSGCWSMRLPSRGFINPLYQEYKRLYMTYDLANYDNVRMLTSLALLTIQSSQFYALLSDQWLVHSVFDWSRKRPIEHTLIESGAQT